ncbi:hypothetical protein [Candidatus Aciduliprofundum boonei]|uniref:Uncharacterized protein n=1 Tax=Aciduliprofundum boonei (strain DSM 19572 / T469) TaxID=439481 RepID=B5ID95_ACIB4|nr:hypothetical protein [Candidatus Aciduliprofundum boonei]ADD08756.1 hypothetical protein Aboo_0947 [Aciduliprofundum boonei T469]EDY35722.1 hypothetical protein ABOONEI_1507 [Aciduliprofundum boonei T469]EDY35746.1 hypothetical protein ABOONEI_1531 [Aciduliprofundum boonei T469]
MNPEDAVIKLNKELGRMDDNLFEVIKIYENFFGEWIVHLKVRRMVKASYSTLKRIAEITGAKDILIERAEGDNLAEIKLMLPK